MNNWVLLCFNYVDKFGLSAAQLEKLALRAVEKLFGKADAQSFDHLRFELYVI